MYHKLYKQILFSLIIFFGQTELCSAQSFGLGFYSHSKHKEERTELNLTPEKSFRFNKGFKLSFDLNLRAGLDQGFGYVVRIIQNDTTNIDIVYKINYQDHRWRFYLVSGEETAIGSFNIDELRLNEWIKFELYFNLATKNVIFTCEDKQISAIPNANLTKSSYDVIFGASDYEHFRTRDVPAMSIRDVKIFSDKKIEHHWPLNEDSGTLTRDKLDGKKATVRNPNWLKPKHENWLDIFGEKMPGHAQVAADQDNEILYIIGSKQLIEYSVSDDTYKIVEYDNSPSTISGRTSIF